MYQAVYQALEIKRCLSYSLSLKDLQSRNGGTVVKNPPVNAGDTGSSSGLGRSHMPWSN